MVRRRSVRRLFNLRCYREHTTSLYCTWLLDLQMYVLAAYLLLQGKGRVDIT